MGSGRGRLPVSAGVAVMFAAVLLAALFLPISPAQALVPLPDYNEPNDSYADATLLTNGETSWGAITEQADKDYFYLDIPGSRQVTVEFTSGAPYRDCKLAFRAAGSDTVADLDWTKNYDSDASFHASGTLGAGRLFAIVSLGTAQVSTAAYTVTVTCTGTGATSFPDVPAGSTYYDAITSLAGEGVVSGYADGKFGPSDLVTRQQFAKMIVRALGYWVSADDDCEFDDVEPSFPGHYLDPNDPLYPDHYVAVAAVHNITVGETPTTFGPYHKIKMAQVTTMVVRAAEDLGIWDSPPHSYTPPFEDFGEPHFSYAREGAAHGLFDDYHGPLTWFEPATRGQCAFFIWKLMNAEHGGEPEPVY